MVILSRAKNLAIHSKSYKKFFGTVRLKICLLYTSQLLDLDDDGAQESAVAFFRVANAENPLMIYIFHQQADGQYEVYAVIEGGGSAISSISYENLDDTPGKEFVVHWQMNDDVHLLGTYSVGDVYKRQARGHAHQAGRGGSGPV